MNVFASLTNNSIYFRVIPVQASLVRGLLFLASAVTIFSGAQLFALGIIGEYLARMHFRIMDKPTYVVAADTATPTA